jgi:hypothetical protein
VKFLDFASPGKHEGRATVFRIARQIFDLPYSVDPVWISRILKPLGATPGAVIASGGCCSGKARLLILCLAERGIRAYQITLYHQAGHAQHCLVEAQINEERLLVDPSYGIYLADKQGLAVSLRDLQRGILPVQVPLSPGLTCGYPNNRYHAFDYALSKTANWTHSITRRTVYWVLRQVSRGSVDRMAVPAWLEWPQNIAIVVGTLVLSVLAAAITFSV